MEEAFHEYVFREIFPHGVPAKGNLIKSDQLNIAGNVKITVEEDSEDGIKIVLKKDLQENIKEIKFVCTCGQTKSIVLDYSE
ncbi:MAG: hypothetical protein ACM3SM_02750 [Bacteroidota bacterium]